MIFSRHSLKRPASWRKKKTSRLVALGPQDPTYIQLEKHFQDAWTHPKKPKPQVHAIFEIVLTEESLVAFLRYRALVELSRVPRYANEQLLFHGTSRSCLLGDEKSRTQLCKIAGCLLCSVIRNSFDVSKCGDYHFLHRQAKATQISQVFSLITAFSGLTAMHRFGTGIYTTACSSILVNRVVVGNPLTRQYNAEELTELPFGYHSVVGVPGADLNYAETVVYANDAIRPAYLIVYAADVPPEVHVADLRSILSTLFKTPIAS
ncbi:hypothetical protein B0H12DRAFT_1204777 [Mycena haematopus]|nr:hypothetical protein B0H12DRAFT_1204777 [Mycena haematopus]